MVLYGYQAPLEQFPNMAAFFKKHFKGIIVGNNDYNPESAEKDMKSGIIDLVSFAKLYITNPDLD